MCCSASTSVTLETHRRTGVHRWVKQRSTEDGSRYLACERCGKEKDTISLTDHYGG
jgi:hypothetical protein